MFGLVQHQGEILARQRQSEVDPARSAERPVSEPLDEGSERPHADRVEDDLLVETGPVGEGEHLAQAHHGRHHGCVAGELHRRAGAERSDVANGAHRPKRVSAAIEHVRLSPDQDRKGAGLGVRHASEDRGIERRGGP